MRNFRIFVLFICAWATCLTSNAQSFKAEKLRKVSEVVGIKKLLLDIPTGQTSLLMASDGQVMCVRTDTAKTVEHIGIPLFEDEMRAVMHSPVYDFLEYAVLNWKYRVNPNTLYLDKVLFKKGNWNSLITERLNECSCSIVNQDDKLYIVTWQSEGRDVVVLGIPIDYELLANDNRRNVEREFIRLLETYENVSHTSTLPVTEKDLKIYGTGGLFVKEGESYILKELNQNVYYELKTIFEKVDTVINNKPVTMTLEDVAPAVVVDTDHPIESLANLIVNDDSSIPDAIISIKFHLSDYHQKHLDVPLSKLKDYIKKQGCQLYFAYSSTQNDVIQGMMLVNNAAQGYNHLFSIRFPVQQIASKSPVVQADAYLYIPPISKSGLFGKVPTKKSGAKIYN